MALIDNLVSYYKLDENSNNTFVADSHGSNHGNANVNTNNINEPVGVINNAKTFNGSNQFINLTDMDFGVSTQKISISLWIKRSDDGFMVAEDSNSGGRGFGFKITGGKMGFEIFGAAFPSTSTTTVGTGAYHHLVITYDKSTDTARYYLDGSADGTSSSGSQDTIPSSTTQVSIGRRNYTGAESYITATIDEIGMWETILTPTEVSELYNSGAGLAYPFAAGPVPVQVEKTGNARIEIPVQEINSWADLDNMRNARSLNYKLMVDLDSTSPGYDTYASSIANGGLGWLPIGFGGTFTGNFEGNNKTISDLYINRSSDYSSLFGSCIGSDISNLGVLNCDITGINFIGGICGSLLNGSITDSSVTGTINGNNDTGGMVGRLNGSSITSSSSTGSIDAGRDVGGLVGNTQSGSVITDSYSNSSVTGDDDYVGGLVGSNFSSTITNSYSTGFITGSFTTGGLVSSNFGTVTNSYYDSQTSGQSDTGKGTPKTTSQMRAEATFIGWDFTNVWSINEGVDYPRLIVTFPVQVNKTGNARIKFVRSNTKTGTARIQIDDEEQVYDGVARLQLIQSENKTGVSRIQFLDNEFTKTGNASIFLQSAITKTGNASIELPVEQVNKTGTARILFEDTEVSKNGNARIKLIQSKDKVGTARIQFLDTETTKTGDARIKFIETIQETKTGNASISLALQIKVEKDGNASISIPDTFKPTFKSINQVPPKMKSVEYFNRKQVKQKDKEGNASIIFI